MGWVQEKVIEAIWGFFANLATDTLNKSFTMITELVLTSTDLNQYININEYLVYVQTIAGALLVLTVAFEAFKQNSGGMLATEEKSIGVLLMQTMWAAALIYFLPQSVSKIFLPINNALIDLIQTIGFRVEVSEMTKSLSKIDPSLGFASLGALMILLSLVLAIGFLIIGIAAGIRYIEILICVIFAPICAISAVRNGEAIQVWIRETTAVVFTQAIHIFLLQVLLKIMGTVQGPMMILLSIGCISVMLKGPQLLRQFLYSSGVGSASVGGVGQAGRMAAMKFMMKSAVPAS